MTRAGLPRAFAAVFVALLPSFAACNVEPFCLDCVDRDTGPADTGVPLDANSDGGPDADLDAARVEVIDAYALPDGCTPGAPELCNAHDDDCDGRIDEGIDTATDERHCGGCGRVCAPPSAFGDCVDGACVMGDCAAGYHDLDGDEANGCEYRCTASAETELRCDRRDEDCDGRIDETFDLMTDGENCGACGRNCRVPRATAACVGGSCVLDTCMPGYYDIDGVSGNGCEYRCTPATPATEICNLIDEDCDGRIDEGDPGGGGACGTDTGECSRGTLRCVAGGLTCTGGVSPTTELCNGLDDDCDGTTDQGNPEGGRACGSTTGVCVPGRETCVTGRLQCTGGITATTEICNGLDDDCDGTIDQGNPGGGGSCGTDAGECVAGTLRCMGGGLACNGSVGPMLDVCNGRDDDCDGVIDQSFNLMTDPRNCGMCGRTCAFANAVAGCAAGSCTLLACRPGFVNLDGNPANGCEYTCALSGAEACNGADDDCDGRTDEGITPPVGFCNPNGVCAGTAARCAGTAGFVCDYPTATYQASETRCDNLDNDCDGAIDEPFPTKGAACNNGGVGACRRTGTMVCNGAGTGVQCNAATGITGTAETCNGIDDDCNGVVDNSPTTNWVPISGSFGNRWIFAYEASRPNATMSSAGTLTNLACSEPNRLPWGTVTPVQAAAACAGIGARLCTEAEWQRACQTSAATACVYSYGAACGTYSAMTCNGRDYSVATDAVLPTGNASNCYASWGGATTQRIFDMSGNLQEWTAQRTGSSPAVYGIRGGSYNDIAGGMTCTYSFEAGGATAATPNTGFRCCRDTAP